MKRIFEVLLGVACSSIVCRLWRRKSAGKTPGWLCYVKCCIAINSYYRLLLWLQDWLQEGRKTPLSFFTTSW